jgi:hypothetical protein
MSIYDKILPKREGYRVLKIENNVITYIKVEE